MKTLIHWPLTGGCCIWYSEEGIGLGYCQVHLTLNLWLRDQGFESRFLD